ncbi:MAG: Abi family protein, partial [Eubacterium sp.]
MKEFKTIHEQIEILKSRGLLIENNQETEIFLLKNNYYRVSGYSLTLRNKDVFYPGSTFQNIIDIYEFDRELRHILMRYLDIIEITFKSIYAYESARLIGPLGYLDKNHFTDEKVYDVTIKKI